MAVKFDPADRKLLFDGLLLGLFLVRHALQAELPYLFDYSAQMSNQTLCFNLVTIQVTPFLALNTLDDLVSQLQNHLAQDWIMEDHQNEHPLEKSIYFMELTCDRNY